MICWHCGKKLISDKIFSIIKDRDKIEHKVHKSCYKYYAEEYRELTIDFDQELKQAMMNRISDLCK